jgi:hypothetical protein
MRLAVLTTCSSLTQHNSVLGPHGSTTDVELWLYSCSIEVNREDIRELRLNERGWVTRVSPRRQR